MYIRDMSATLKRYAKFPVVAVLGPRQSGKTTLVRQVFSSHTFLSFEDIETRTFAMNDPKKFLEYYTNGHGVIIDEFQHVPQFLSYIQIEVDTKKRPGYFILTGSSNFLANQAITQSLADRIGILTLLPLSIHELDENKIIATGVDQAIFEGGYPRLYHENFLPTELYPSYIQSYVERDIRQLVNIGDLNAFQRFIQLCAARIGQLLNMSSLANECGITVHIAKQWLSILEASYVLFLLQPHFKNFNKRITKSPKLYFFDTGIACSLLRISSAEVLALHPLRGHLFECFIIADLYKQYANQAIGPHLYFWRDLNGRYEVDCLLDEGISLIPIEVKAGHTVTPDFFKGLEAWYKIIRKQPNSGYVVYGGDLLQERTHGTVVGWKKAGTLVAKVRQKLYPTR